MSKSVKQIVEENRKISNIKDLETMIESLKNIVSSLDEETCIDKDTKQYLKENVKSCIDLFNEAKVASINEAKVGDNIYKSGMIRLYKEEGRWHLNKESRNGEGFYGELSNLTRNDIINIKNCCADALAGDNLAKKEDESHVSA